MTGLTRCARALRLQLYRPSAARPTRSSIWPSARGVCSKTKLDNASKLSKLPVVDFDRVTFRSPRSAYSSDKQTTGTGTVPDRLFPDLTFRIQSNRGKRRDQIQNWAVIGPHSLNTTPFLQAIKGDLVPEPASRARYPLLTALGKLPSTAIGYVGFDADTQSGDGGAGGGSGGNLRGAYLAARFESYRDETDISVLDYITRNTGLNVDETVAESTRPSEKMVKEVADQMMLTDELLTRPLSVLSNGQLRRARIGRALLEPLELLLLDGPMMGLDPGSARRLTAVLGDMTADERGRQLVLALRAEDPIPDWISHVVLLSQDCAVLAAGPRDEVMEYVRVQFEAVSRFRWLHDLDPKWKSLREYGFRFEATAPPIAEARRSKKLSELRKIQQLTGDGHVLRSGTGGRMESMGELRVREQIHRQAETALPEEEAERGKVGEPVIEMDGVEVSYATRRGLLIGGWTQPETGHSRPGFHWTVRRGDRWGVFGPNGSGKSTVTALVTSEHPQAYAQPIKMFGRSRLPVAGEVGMSIFELQRRVGIVSPEIHSFFPRHLSVRQTIESGWAETPTSPPRLHRDIDLKVEAAMAWFQHELNPLLGRTPNMEDDVYHRVGTIGNARAFEAELEQTELHGFGLDWAETTSFGELSFSAQRLALFIRAILPQPDLVVLDEAFSAMDDNTREAAMLFLAHGQNMVHTFRGNRGTLTRGPAPHPSYLAQIGRVRIPGLRPYQALINIAHRPEEVPGLIRQWVCLPEPTDKADQHQQPPRFGVWDRPFQANQQEWWDEIWGQQ